MESIDIQYVTYLPLIAHWADCAWAGHGLGMGWALVIVNNRFDFDIWTPNDEWSPLILNMPHGFLL